jgi:hypothetical protein
MTLAKVSDVNYTVSSEDKNQQCSVEISIITRLVT